MATNKYYVKMKIDFAGYVLADSQAEAEELSWNSWGESADADIAYDGVYSIDVEDMGALCEECDNGADECECEEDDSDVYTDKEEGGE